MPITSSTFTEGPRQADGRRFVRERHVDDQGRSYEFDWLGSQDANAVLMARRKELDRQLQEEADALAVVAGTALPMSKLEFRALFTIQERLALDEFNATFEDHPQLTAEQKRSVRTGLQDYHVAQNITRPFNARVALMLNLYVSLGLLTAARRDEIMAAGG